MEAFKDCDEEWGDGKRLEMVVVFFKGAVDEEVIGVMRIGVVEFVVMDEEEGVDEIETIGDVSVDGDFSVVGAFEEGGGAFGVEEDGHQDGGEVGEDVDLVLVGGLV